MAYEMTDRQARRQEYRSPKSGRYDQVNPCYRCGKSAGDDYWSVLCDESDAAGRPWHDTALCCCHPCATHLQKLVDTDLEAAWAETQHADWGKLPRGKARA
jgi:hypothetical protein